MAREHAEAPRTISLQFDPDLLEPFLRAMGRGIKTALGKLRAAEKRRPERVVPRREPAYWDQVLGKGPAGRDDD